MKYLRFSVEQEIKEGVLLDNKEIREIEGSFYTSFTITERRYQLGEVNLLSPCLPSKIVCVGLNYVDHAQEVNMPLPEEPVIFIKPSTTLIGPDEVIIYPELSKQVDYEAELAIVIKNAIRDISPLEAEKHVLGYTCCNDVTARDLQQKDGQWTRAKSFDTFCPLGPWIVPNLDTSNLRIELSLNGQVKQSSSTKEMIFKPVQLVSFVSKVMTLLPGDVIITGTPPGVGPMKLEDVVEVSIEKIGILRNYLKKTL